MNPQASPMRMNGLRLSNPFMYLRQPLAGSVRDPRTHLYRRLALEEINIEFLNYFLAGEVPHIACCLEAEASDTVRAILNHHRQDMVEPSIQKAGTLSMYPHKHSLHVLGTVLEIFGHSSHRFMEMASSGSTLAFVVDFKDQEKIAEALVQKIDLPETHTPFRQVTDSEDIYQSLNKKPETSATYTESRVRTYGIIEKPGLFMYRMETDPSGLAAAGENIRRLADSGIRFEFVSAAAGPGKQIAITIIAGKSDYKAKKGEFILPLPEVDLLCFQGPHFGDRHGIADRAFSALLDNGIAIRSAGCVGASIFIAVDAKTGLKAKEILGVVFDDPFTIASSLKRHGMAQNPSGNQS